MSQSEIDIFNTNDLSMTYAHICQAPFPFGISLILSYKNKQQASMQTDK